MVPAHRVVALNSSRRQHADRSCIRTVAVPRNDADADDVAARPRFKWTNLQRQVAGAAVVQPVVPAVNANRRFVHMQHRHGEQALDRRRHRQSLPSSLVETGASAGEQDGLGDQPIPDRTWIVCEDRFTETI